MPRYAGPHVNRRVFPKPDELADWRHELGRWGFWFNIGSGGYWYAQSSDGLVCLTDKNPRRLFHLTMAYIQTNLGETEAALDSFRSAELANQEGEQP